MNKLLIALSKNELSIEEQNEIQKQFEEEFNWCLFLGRLFYHKIQFRAWSHIKSYSLEKPVPQFVWRALEEHYNMVIMQKNIIIKELKKIVLELNKCGVKYALLKGVPLEKQLFPSSGRESNDIDILVSRDDIKQLHNVLNKLGYKNSVSNSRQEEVYYLLNTHQTLPYKKAIITQKSSVTIDLQFALTLQKQLKYNIDIKEIINNGIEFEMSNSSFRVLNSFYEFIMLCTHLYGEAILHSEICKGKDLQLSKIADIYEWIEKNFYDFDWEAQAFEIVKRNLTIPVVYSVKLVETIYKNFKATKILEKFSVPNLEFMNEYRDENFNIKKWNKSVEARLFSDNLPKNIT